MTNIFCFFARLALPLAKGPKVGGASKKSKQALLFRSACTTFVTEMKIVRCRYLPFKGFTAINLLGVLFVKPGAYLSETLLRHERIHTAQMPKFDRIN